jgi:hypothetical protein
LSHAAHNVVTAPLAITGPDGDGDVPGGFGSVRHTPAHT